MPVSTECAAASLSFRYPSIASYYCQMIPAVLFKVSYPSKNRKEL